MSKSNGTLIKTQPLPRLGTHSGRLCLFPHGGRTNDRPGFPLKLLAWEATDGKVWVSYNDPNYLKQRFSLSDELVKNIAIIAPLINEALSYVDHK